MKPIRHTLLMVTAFALAASVVPSYASSLDDGIESSARKSHVFRTYLKGDDVNVDSRDGVVTLTGTVSDASRMSLAEETVAALPGVKTVDNRLEVRGGRPVGTSDAWLGAKVKTVLMFHRNVSALHTEVDVKDGVVTLRGDAESLAQKDLTTEYAKDVEGVKEVRNEMNVSMIPERERESVGDLIDDASITSQVKMALLLHRSTSALETKVETTKGVVSLRGKATNAAEKDLVTKLVTDIDGVKRVENGMTIGESR